MKRIALLVLLCSFLPACSTTGGGGNGTPPPPPSNSPVWAQWGSNPQHSGMVNVVGQNLTNKLFSIKYDSFVDQEKAEQAPLNNGVGVLTVHYQAPITDGNDVYMMMKTGSYTSCNNAAWVSGVACGPNTWNTMIWNEARFSWENGSLVEIWCFMSDWKPEPNATNFGVGFSGLLGWEPVFHPVDANNFIYVPGATGSVWKVDKTKGTGTQIAPFNSVNGVSAANTFVSGPLTADANGNIFYNVIELNVTGTNPWDADDVVNAWLVKITPSDAATMVTYATLVPGAPPANSFTCLGTFFNLGDGGASLPWPPSSNATPPPQACGSQRPGVNIAPAVAPDGTTIYTVSLAHFDGLQAYLVAVNSDLTPKWTASLQNRLTDGCGVLLVIAPPNNNTTPNSCRNGTTVGVDPTTNANGSASVVDEASSSPTVLPDGSIIFGALDNYNFSRGHLFHFDAQGNYVNAFAFGWDSTPGVYAHNGTYSILIKDNHYPSPAYCGFNNPVCFVVPAGPYYVSQVDANMNIEWSFKSTTIDNQHPNGYEWCINMPAIDMNGNVYVNSEDGNIYELPQGNQGVFTTPAGKKFLNIALGAAYTPLSIGIDGKLYTQNNGRLFVVGN
jgi:hypothetical protein